MSIGERIRELRKIKGLKQQQFAKRIKRSTGTVANYEIGRRIPDDLTVATICKEFDINEEWLREGTGEIEVQRPREEKIADFIGDLLHEEDDGYKHRLIAALACLDYEDWEYLEKLSAKMVENMKKKKGSD